ncbi:MAG: phenylalanine--tRNA ligase subunit alpha [Actinomycetota bacterium]
MTTEAERTIATATEEALARIAAASTTAEVREAETAAMGRKAPMSQVKQSLATATPDERKVIGRALNEARAAIESAVAEREAALRDNEEAHVLAADRVDVTLPGRRCPPGHPHPISLMQERIVDVFTGMGFQVAEGPEVETDWYNFEALNIGLDHPARSMQDTLFLDRNDERGTPLLLRTHTSPVQIRSMQAQQPPLYIVVPGRTFRRDPFDATHSPNFHQIEGLAVDRDISLSDLKGVLTEFARAIFGPEQRVRLRPSYFPFTEPSAEVDVVCPRCGGEGCSACSRSGWMEIMGAGMVHPNVLRAAGYDPSVWSGFAFGMGVERVAMTAWPVGDIRNLYENDLRFLARFAG